MQTTELDTLLFQTFEEFKCTLPVDAILIYLYKHKHANYYQHQIKQRVEELVALECLEQETIGTELYGYNLKIMDLDTFLSTSQPKMEVKEEVDSAVGMMVNLLQNIVESVNEIREMMKNMQLTMNQSKDTEYVEELDTEYVKDSDVEEKPDIPVFPPVFPHVVQVKSFSRSDENYDVDYQSGTCNCSNFQFCGPRKCKHIKDVINNYSHYGLTQNQCNHLLTLYP